MGNSLAISQSIETLARQAIEAAISLNWDDAVKLNQKILSLTRNDVEALNRLARAHWCLGGKEEAQKLYLQVLEIDPYNIIARKNLDKITKSNNNDSAVTNHQSGNGHLNLAKLFLFEPGKTKIISLLNLAPPTVLASLNCGDFVLINPKNHSVTITNVEKVYLGALPDDLAHRLIAFIAGGNKYDAYIKNASPKTLVIFIREVYRAPKFVSQPSFVFKRVFAEESEASFY